MCIGSDEPGGPRRCAAHTRKRRDDTAAHLDAAQRRVASLTTKHADACRQIEDVYRDAGVTRNPFHELVGTDERSDGLSAEQQHRIEVAARLRDSLSAKLSGAEAQLHRRQDAATKARDEYFTTREGVGVLAADVDRLALLTSLETDPDKRSQLEGELRSTMRTLATSEQTMLDEQRRIEQRWGMNPRPQVRGARLGIGDGDTTTNAAALVAAGRCMSGSYTNTFRADPDAQASSDSAPDGGAQLRCSRMELVRTTAEGQRLTLAVPMEASHADPQGGPSVAQTLKHAVTVADSYDSDYSRWATAHGYDTDPQAAWRGASSYSEGRAAWEVAHRVHDGVAKFLPPTDYSMILSESRRQRRSVDTSA